MDSELIYTCLYDLISNHYYADKAEATGMVELFKTVLSEKQYNELISLLEEIYVRSWLNGG